MEHIEILFDIIEAGIEILFLYLVLRPRTKSIAKNCLLGIIFTAVLTLTTILINSIQSLNNLNFFIFIVVIFIFSELYSSDSFWKKGYAVLIDDLIVSVSGLFTYVFVPIILDIEPESLFVEGNNEIRLFSLCFAKFTQLILIIFLALLLRKIEKKFNVNYNVSEIIMIIVINIASSFLINIVYTDDVKDKNIMIVGAVICLLSMNFAVLYYTYGMLKKEHDDYELRLFMNNIEAEVKKAESDEEAEERIKQLRHEIKNEYIPVYQLLTENNYSEAQSKLKEIIGDAEKVMYETARYNCGDSSVNAVLNYCAKRCASADIIFNCRVEIITCDNDTARILCSVLLNVIKNAIEAAETSNDKKMSIDLIPDEGYIKLIVKNSCNEHSAEFIQEMKTSKADKAMHGYGLKAIKQKIRECNGIYEYHFHDNMFITEIMIPTDN